MATLAVFIALGGTAMAASYLVSSNSQVGPNVIAGHAAPAGTHSNLIPGSVAPRDLKVGTSMRTVTLPGCPSTSTPEWGGKIQYGRDAFGFVHVDANVDWCGGYQSSYPTVYTLPVGFRPQHSETFAPGESVSPMTIGSTGAVTAGQVGELSGATYRCYPSGQSGCP